jgi:hypothetical protein
MNGVSRGDLIVENKSDSTQTGRINYLLPAHLHQ